MKKLKLDPIFKDLPERLKDPKNFKRTEMRLRVVLKTDHKHKTIKAYMNCEECKANLEERRKLMKEIGFKNLEQYNRWRGVMSHFIPMSKSIKYEKTN